jgi:hypothetical protein
MKKRLMIIMLIITFCYQVNVFSKKPAQSLRCVCPKTEFKTKLTVDINYRGKDCDEHKTKACKKKCNKCGYKTGDFLKPSNKK